MSARWRPLVAVSGGSSSFTGAARRHGTDTPLEDPVTTPRRPNHALDCPRCGRNMAGGKVLLAHLRQVHRLSTDEAVDLIPKMVWRCAFCGQELPDQDGLARHVQADHGIASVL